MILRTEQQGRAVRVWAIAKADEAAFNPRKDACFEFYFADGTVDEARVETLIAERKAADAEAAKIALIDAAIAAEVEKRKASVDYSKNAADALAKVFTTTAEVPK